MSVRFVLMVDGSMAMHGAGRLAGSRPNRLYSLVVRSTYCDIRQEMRGSCGGFLQDGRVQPARTLGYALQRCRQSEAHVLGGVGSVEGSWAGQDAEIREPTH